MSIGYIPKRDKNGNRVQDVATELERPDKDLVLASDEQPFVGMTCVLSIRIPGTVGQSDSRKIAGGRCFTDVYGWGDRATKVKLVDKDYVYAGVLYPAEPEPGVTWAEAMPNGVDMGGYTDDDLPDANRGWRMWCGGGNQGTVDVVTLAGFGNLLAMCYLEITLEKQVGNPASRAALNAWWGKPKA